MAESYEVLRAAVLRSELASCLGVGLLRRRGMAAWIRDKGQEASAEVDEASRPNLALCAIRPDLPARNDLTSLLAGIIVAIAMEPVHV